MGNMDNWSRLQAPPEWALKPIMGGRLKGKTDINPQWRYQAMTEVYGPYGVGWKIQIIRTWTDPGPQEQVFAMAEVAVSVRDGEVWSEPAPGVGGDMLIEKESGGLHANDEAFKMAITDAIGAALKLFGVAADIYAGQTAGSKYGRKGTATEQPKKDLADELPKSEEREMIGPVTAIGKKDGETSGKKWTKYVIEIEGQQFTTFDLKIAEEAKDIQSKGATAILTYKATPKGNNIVSLARDAF